MSLLPERESYKGREADYFVTSQGHGQSSLGIETNTRSCEIDIS